jgi:hypothetical protein
MPNERDPSLPKPGEDRPGWQFDGWGVARGGRRRTSGISARPYGADRTICLIGWPASGILILASALTDSMWLGIAGLLVAAATGLSRRLVWRLRRRRGLDQ